MEEYEYEMLKLCKKQELTDEDKAYAHKIFTNKMLAVDYDDNIFLMSSAFFGNSDMIEILKCYDVDINIEEKKAYRLAKQNNNSCMKLLL